MTSRLTATARSAKPSPPATGLPSDRPSDRPATSARRAASDPAITPGCNVAILRGEILAEPSVRELANGSCVTQFDVSTSVGGRRKSVPVSWNGDHLADLGQGEQVLVTGAVERRFFRAGGSTQSRTEVVAEAVVPVRRRAAVRRTLESALAAVHGGAESPPGTAR